MNNQYRNNAQKVIHFTKWSNTTYAVFNSIGKVILIGKLSKIVSGLVTVKSIAGRTLAYLVEVLNTEKEQLTEFIEHITADELFVLNMSSIHDVKTTYKSLGLSSTEINDVLNQLKYIKAFEGLFSFVESALIWLIRHFFYKELKV